MDNIIQNIAAVNIDNVVVVNDTNGDYLPLSIDSAITYVSENALISISDPNTDNWQYNVDKTISHIVWCVQGKPAILEDVTLEQFRLSIKYVKLNMLRYNIIKMLKIPGINQMITVRNADLIRNATFTAYYNNVNLNVNIVNAAKKLRTAVITNLDFRRTIEENSDFPLILLLVNANYRKQNAGHNFHSYHVDDVSSNAYKYAKFAGQRTEEFRDFLRDYGHDMWHFIDSLSLTRVCDAIVGVTPFLLPINTRISNILVDVNNAYLHQVLSIDQAATDRYPFGNVGVSAIVLGIAVITYTIKSCSTKLMIPNLDTIITTLDTISNRLTTKRFSRSAILTIRKNLSDFIAFSYGYGQVNGYFDDVYKNNKSLIALVNRNNVSRALGSDFGRYVRNLNVDAGAMANVFGGMVQSLIVSGDEIRALPDIGNI